MRKSTHPHADRPTVEMDPRQMRRLLAKGTPVGGLRTAELIERPDFETLEMEPIMLRDLRGFYGTQQVEPLMIVSAERARIETVQIDPSMIVHAESDAMPSGAISMQSGSTTASITPLQVGFRSLIREDSVSAPLPWPAVAPRKTGVIFAAGVGVGAAITAAIATMIHLFVM